MVGKGCRVGHVTGVQPHLGAGMTRAHVEVQVEHRLARGGAVQLRDHHAGRREGLAHGSRDALGGRDRRGQRVWRGLEQVGGGRDFPRDGQARREYVGKLALMGGITPARAEALLSRYGTRALAFCATLRGRSETMLTEAPDHSVEEIRHLAATEKVGGLDDILYRRTLIGLLGGDSPALRAELASVLEGAPERRESA